MTVKYSFDIKPIPGCDIVTTGKQNSYYEIQSMLAGLGSLAVQPNVEAADETSIHVPHLAHSISPPSVFRPSRHNMGLEVTRYQNFKPREYWQYIYSFTVP